MKDITRQLRDADRPFVTPGTRDIFAGDPTVPTFEEEVSAHWRQSWAPQLYHKIQRQRSPADPNFNPYENYNSKYSAYADQILSARSKQEQDQVIAQIEANLADEKIMADGEWGIVAALAAGIADPVNLIPIPIARGVGLLRGAKLGAQATTVATGVTEFARVESSPTATYDEMLQTLAISGLLGAGFGGFAGRAMGRGSVSDTISRVTETREFKRAYDTMNKQIAENEVIPFSASNEGISEVRYSRRGERNEVEGTYQPVAIIDKSPHYTPRKASDGVSYQFREDLRQYVRLEDLEVTTPRPVDPEIIEELGEAFPEYQTVMNVDDGTIKGGYAEDSWRHEIAQVSSTSPDLVVKHADDLVRYEIEKALIRRASPRKRNEGQMDYDQRVAGQAVDKMLALRQEYATAPILGQQWLADILEKGNFSPVAKNIRMTEGDQTSAEFMFSLGGDMGTASKANKLGVRTPDSLVMRIQQHKYKYYKFKQEFDAAWNEYASGGQMQDGGREVLGQNVSAAAHSFRNWARTKRGETGVITYSEFSEMVGRAVYDSSEFQMNNKTVPPQARKAAKAFTKLMKEYERDGLSLGIFTDMRNAQKQIGKAKRTHDYWDGAIRQWLFRGSGRPPMPVAIRRADIEKNMPPTYNPVVSEVVIEDPLYFGSWQAGDEFVDESGNLVIRPNEVEGDATNLDGAHGIFEFDRSEVNVEAANAGESIVIPAGRWNEITPDKIRREMRSEYIEAPNEDELMGRIQDEYGSTAWLDNDISEQLRWKDDLDGAYLNKEEVETKYSHSLSQRQRDHYDFMRTKRADALNARRDQEALYENLRKSEHEFKDKLKTPTNYFPRNYMKWKIQEDRVKFTAMLEDYYTQTGTSPDKAGSMAEETVDRILDGTNEGQSGPKYHSSKHLNQRALTMPNDHTYTHPTLGEVVFSDYIDTNVLAVGESYATKMGGLIETTKMFGDQNASQRFAEMENYLVNKGYSPKFVEEYMGRAQLTLRAVLGTLRVSDPMRWDNRLARNIKNWMMLATMGKTTITSMPELVRPFAVMGIGEGFKPMMTRYIQDLEKIRPNIEYLKMSGEITDMALNSVNARYVTGEVGEHILGGNAFEKWLQESIPGYFKLNGLTPLTTWLKEVTMFASQHDVMSKSIKMANGSADERTIMQMASIGIELRDAQLLARMPYEALDGGTLLPSVDKWQGHEGLRARQKMIDAVQANARRAIVTPSVGDRSLLFEGVWESGGKVAFESDMMTLPLQFMSYAVAAHNKVLISGLQGRDANMVGGMVGMMIFGLMANYIKTPEMAWKGKDYDQIIMEAYEAAGFSGFWFGNMNEMIEKFSSQQFGVRPMLGIDPKFKPDGTIADKLDVAGPGPNTLFDLSRIFWDPELSVSQRAQIAHRAIPYNNVFIWANIAKQLTRGSAASLEELAEGN